MAEPLADAALTRFLAEFNAQPSSSAAATGPGSLHAGAEDRAATRPMGPEMHTVRDLAIPPGHIPARLYRPAGSAAMIVYLHGGGCVTGSIHTYDRACRRLAATSGLAVLSLGLPAGTGAPVADGGRSRHGRAGVVASGPPELDPPPPAVGIAGDSAGGAVAALACLKARDEAPEVSPVVQALIYANTDLTNSARRCAATKARPTRPAWVQPECRSPADASKAWSTTSCSGT